MRVVLAASLIAGLARADEVPELDAVTKTAPTCDAARAHCFGIRLHIASGEAGLVAAPDWIATQLANANRHFASIDVGFQLAGVDTRSEPHLHSRKDRDALGAHVGGPVIDVFITGQLDNIDDNDVAVYGVTWRKKGRKFIIVSAAAWPRTLAHELGHFFGLPHSSYAISIMNKTERTEPPVEQRTFAPEEIVVMKAALERLLRDKVIVDMAKP
jgi:hypothetical protein